MSTKHLFLTLLAAFSLAFACQKPEANLSFPSIEISLTEAAVAEPASSFTVQVISNRAWKVTSDVPWIAVDPDSGSGSMTDTPVTVTVMENTSFTRSGHVVFDIVYDNKTLTIDQAGNGSPEDYIIFYNDFDKETATQSYGSGGSSWPYLDQFEGWKNQTGVGVADITYDFTNVSARNNSNSNGTYSDYAGSGLNNLLFGANGHIAVKNLDLKGFKKFRLSFGTEKYDNNDKTALFDPAEMPVYLSADGAKWIPLSYTYLGTAAGRWNLAEAYFSVPDDVTKLSIYVTATMASAYRMDDLKLEVPVEGDCPVLDFSNGSDLPSGGGGGGGGSDYENAPAKTVQEFIAAADKNTYYKLTGTVSKFNASYCSFDLTDNSGSIYVYSVDNKDSWSSKIKNGGTVVLAGKYSYYEKNAQHEVVNAQILSFTEGGDVTPPSGDAKSVTVAEFNAAPESDSQVYELVGTIGGAINATYGNFDLSDETGTVYVYGLTATNLGYGAKNDQSYSSLGLKDGDKIKIRGYRGSFNGKIEVMYAWFISKVDGGGGGDTPPGDVPFAKLDPSNFKEGKYVIAYPSGSSFAIMKNAVQSNYYVAASSFDLKEGKAPTEEHIFTVAKSGSGYTIKNNEGGYVGVEVSGTHYNLKPGLSSPYVWTFTAQSDGSIEARGSDSGDYVMSYDAAHNDFTLFNKTPSLPTFYYVEGAPSGGGDTPGGDTPGGGGSSDDGSAITWTVGKDNQPWAAATSSEYGAGYSATAGGMTVAYYKASSTTTPLDAQADHIRVYKNSHLSISVAGKRITGVELTCMKAGTSTYCYDLSVAGGSTATADKDALKVTWTGDVAAFEADAPNGQLRISQIKVSYK